MELALTIQVAGSIFIVLCVAWYITNWRNEQRRSR
jgi:hypothetical protein